MKRRTGRRILSVLLALVMMLAKYMTKYSEKVRSEYRFGGSFVYGVVYPGI